MSLDVYLIKSYPKCEHCGRDEEDEDLYHANITHNLNSMAEEAGIYGITWRPEENGIERAAQLIEPLADGIARMKSDPDRFRRFNPENGWGSYDAFIPWLESYLSACREHPDALVTASR